MGFIFDPERLQEIGKSAVGLPHEEMCRKIIDRVAEEWPGHVETREEWMFSLAGGATGIMSVMHGSLTEYVLIFGTSVGTEAFSGRYRMDIWDTVLTGEMWTYTEESFREKKVTRPGEMALLKKGQAKGFRFSEDCWVLEYGRGVVPASLPFALGDAVFSGMDGTTIFKTFAVYGKQVYKNLLQGKV